jgi:glutamyl-tRNA reductase
MAIRKQTDETYEQWVERARIFELDNAHKNLKKGMPIDEVLEILANKLTQKIMHPLLTSVKETPDNYNNEESKTAYEKAYLSRRISPPADHVTDD